MYTSTARRSFADRAAVQTFKYRQSSLIDFSGIRYSSVHIRKGTGLFCIGLGPNCVQSRTPLQGAAGCGARHRNAPTGGAANGIPLNTCTPSTTAPETNPSSTLTLSNPWPKPTTPDASI